MNAALRRWMGPALIVLCGLGMAAWTWGGWADPLVDFGRELYVPWQLSEGAVLYRDIAWFNGPLSPWFNALLFAVFGVGVSTLVWANLVLLALLVALLFRLCSRLADRTSATVACLVFLLVFAFGQLVGIANYNWVCPYSHEVTHGVLLGVAALVCLDAWGGGPRRRGLGWVAGAGLLCGLAFLTKAETFLAAFAGCLAAFAAFLRTDRRGAARAAAAFAIAAVLPAALAFAVLANSMPTADAARGVLGSWPSVLQGEVAELPFYRAGMGVDVPAERLRELGLWTLGWGAVLGTAFAAAWLPFLRRSPSSPRRPRVAIVTALAVGALLWTARDSIAWNDALRPLPLFVLAGGAFALVAVLRGRAQGTMLGCCIFALALLGKMILHARALNYGFALAVPATLLVVVWTVGRLPAWLDARGAAGGVLRGAACALLLFGAGEYVRTTARYLGYKTAEVADGADAFRSDLRGGFVNETLAALSGAHATSLVVVPEGVMINYLARIPNPTPFVNFMPPEEILFGEAAWVRALRGSPPQVICIVHKDTSEYGLPRFGEDYGRAVRAWIDEHYRVVAQLGDPPLKPGTVFGIRILALGKEPRDE